MGLQRIEGIELKLTKNYNLYTIEDNKTMSITIRE